MGDVIIDGLTGANRLVFLDANGKIPALDGSAVTAIAGANFSTGTIPVARIDTGTAAGKVVKLDGNAKIPAVSGAAITGIVGATQSSSDPTISTNPSGGVGTEWQNTSSGEVFVCTDATAGSNTWRNVGEHSGDVTPPKWYGARGVFGGGYHQGGPYVNIMEYITIATTGNTTDFGDLLNARYYLGGYSGDGRGCYFGGRGADVVNVIQYITIASVGNAIDFGDLTTTLYAANGLSDGSRGVKFGGGTTSQGYNVIDYVTIATPGNAIDFGDMLAARNSAPSGMSNGTYGLMATGNEQALSNVIEKITVATTGNSVDWADLTVTQFKGAAALGGDTRGLWMGGWSNTATNAYLNVIQYVTIATQANAIDFGDLTNSVAVSASGITDATKGVTGGGNQGTYFNVIQYVTIATTGNATDFGDLSAARDVVAGVAG